MKNLFFGFLTLLIAPLASNAQIDCVVDLVFEAYFEYVTVGSVDFPEGATLNWSINGEMMNNGSDVIDLSFGLFLNGPVTVCVSFVSDACPEGVEICETVDLNDIIGGGSDCPEILGAMQQSTGPCNWIFEVEGSGEGAEVNWDFGDGTGESAGHIADHHYAEDGDYIVTAAYSDLLCEGVVLSTVISVEGCGEVEDDCTIEFDYEFYDGYAIFEAYNYPENVELVWTYNNEVYATGTHIIEVLEPNPFPEDGVTICVGYESENCPEGVFACEWLGMEDECELELDGWFENNMGYFEAYGYPAEVNLIWSINGAVVAEGVNEVELMNADFPEGFHLCVWYHNDECGVVETCEWINPAGGDCPEQIEVIFPKWDMCSWAFGLANGEENSDVSWDFGDGSEVEGGSFWASHNYESDGAYLVSVQYYSESCPDGVSLHLTIVVEGCGEEDCINQDQIDNDMLCTEEWNPVCGCDDITYSNHCYAYYYGGVTSWVEGECENQGCIYEDGTFYNVGSEVFLSECEYIYCEGPNNWSSVIEIPDCGEEEFCPNNINIIPPKWDFCTWAFEIDTVWMGAGNPPSWMEVGWDFGDGSVLSNEDFWSHHVYDTDGVYEVNVQYWDSNCPNGVELSVVIQVEGCGEVGVNHLEDASSWNVFPVPTSEGVTVRGLPLGLWPVKMYDYQGRVVLEVAVSNGETISLKELINGWYTMQIVGVESSAKRVVIQR
ncbi:MAG: PKD domain-containing protein [Bacteroidetes bacterium]|nr:PKD domain-containing protein [Bacteroidota bacterium]